MQQHSNRARGLFSAALVFSLPTLLLLLLLLPAAALVVNFAIFLRDDSLIRLIELAKKANHVRPVCQSDARAKS